MPLIEVSVPAAGVPDSLTYHLPEAFWADDLVGRRVKVNLRNRPVVGVVTEASTERSEAPPGLKSVEVLLDTEPCVTTRQLELCRFVAEYYMAPLGEVIRLCLPPDTPRTMLKDKLPKRRRKKAYALADSTSKSVQLNSEQAAALKEIISSDKKAFLLEGVTGSGKTEVYIHATEWALAQGKSVLLVVPEIALTPQLKQRFADQLDAEPIMLHSGLKNTERRDAFESLLKDEPRIVLGARSALFAPLPNLGLIIVDEEHDPSYKQDDTPRYHARDVALWRAQQEGASIVLGSATPSLESRVGAERGRLAHLYLKNRASPDSKLPTIEIIDLKSRALHDTVQKGDRSQSDGQSMCILSGPLRTAMTETLNRGEQVLLFLNRRGYAPIAVCDSCGHLVQCPHCSVSLTYHQRTNLLQCHQCDYRVPLLKHCPDCHEGPLLCLGLGTERVEKEVQLFFPDARIVRLDRDSANTPAKMNQILNEVRSGKANILIGTQMSAKGHDFPGLSLVGVILADIGLSMPDFRASERTFQLLTQVAGRAGRRDTPGRVLIQTFDPANPVFSCVKAHDINRFSEIDAEHRKECKQPPYVRSALIRVESEDQTAAQTAATQIFDFLKPKLTTASSLLGPAPAPIERLRNKWRIQLYLRSATHTLRCEILKDLPTLKLKNARMTIDIDPVQML
ncbi:MAG: primosomal protein N' [Myxococcota bacterium]